MSGRTMRDLMYAALGDVDDKHRDQLLHVLIAHACLRGPLSAYDVAEHLADQLPQDVR